LLLLRSLNYWGINLAIIFGILRVNDDSCSSPVEPYDGSAEGVVAELPTPFYVTFVIAVGTVAAVILAALTVRMIFAKYSVSYNVDIFV
jgi:hypothetical protein